MSPLFLRRAKDRGAGDPQDTLAELRLEVEQVAKARSLGRVDPAQLPRLAELAGEATPEAILGLVVEAIGDLDETRREAATFLLGDTDQRWQRTYRARSTDAAKRLGIGSYNTFRDRKTADGLSHHDRLLGNVARELTKRRSGTIDGESPDRVGNEAHGTRRSAAGRVRYLWMAGAATLAAVVALVIVFSSGWIGSAGAPVPNLGRRVGGCDIPVAGSTNPSDVPDELVSLMTDTFDSLGGTAVLGCPKHGVEHWGDLWLQHFLGTDARPRGFLVADLDSSVSLWVEWSIVEEYRNVLNGELQTEGGLPVEAGLLEGRHVLHLSRGGLLIAHRPGGPAFWIPGEAVDLWLGAGGPSGELGVPMTDVRFEDGRPHQDYERGLIREGDPLQATTEIRSSDDVEGYLSQLEPFDSGILRSSDGTAWWIDAAERHWIPDGGVWNCVGGDSVVIDYEAPGWVIGSYPAGSNASCQ